MKIAVIGAGSWGTALAQVLAGNGHNVGLWARKPEVVRAINAEHHNPRYLSDEVLSERIVATLSHEDALLRAKAAVIVTPSNLLRGVGRALDAAADPRLPIVVCSKGVEEGSGLLPIDVMASEMGGRERFAVLSGPNHAEEVIRGVPAATVVASPVGGHGRVLPGAVCHRGVPHLHERRRVRRGAVRGVQERHRHRRGPVLRHGVRRQHGGASCMTRGLAEMSRLVVALRRPGAHLHGAGGRRRHGGHLHVACIRATAASARCWQAAGTLDDFAAETHMVAEGALACKTIGRAGRRPRGGAAHRQCRARHRVGGAGCAGCGRVAGLAPLDHGILRHLTPFLTPRCQSVDRGLTEAAAALPRGPSWLKVLLVRKRRTLPLPAAPRRMKRSPRCQV